MAMSSSFCVQNYTSYRKVHFSYRWIINDAKNVLLSAKHTAKTSAFTIQNISVDWTLEATINEYQRSGDSSYSLLMVVMKTEDMLNVTKIWVGKGTLSILDSTNFEMKMEKVYDYNAWLLNNDLRQTCAIIAPLSEIKNVEEYTHNNTLSILLKMELFILTDPHESIAQYPLLPDHHLHEQPPGWDHHLQEQMKAVLEQELFTDISIITKKKVFKVHRALLASQSDVFKTMFMANMKEKADGVVEISDVDSEVMSDLISYIYTGSAPNVKSLAQELLIAADKYNLPHLMLMCENEIMMNLTSDNVTGVYIIADRMHVGIDRSNSLKKACVQFIKDNLSSVLDTKSWKEFEENSGKTVSEIFKILKE